MFGFVGASDLLVAVEVSCLFASEFFDFFLSVGEALLELGLGFVQLGGVFGAVEGLLVLLVGLLLSLDILKLSSQKFFI